MADWGNVQNALVQGFQTGQATGGGRLSALGFSLKRIAEQLKQERETEEEQKRNILGIVQTQLIKNQLDPEMQLKQQLYEKVLGNQDVSSPVSGVQEEQNKESFQPESFDIGGMTFKRKPSEAEATQEAEREAKKQSLIASEKEKQVNIGKVSRLSDIANTIEKRFMETSPYSGKITKTGLTPVLGLIDVWKSNLQATSAQINDKAYRDFVGGIRAQLARAMGDVGNLSEYEQKAVLKLVPTLLDNKETAMKKLFNLRELIASIQSKGNNSTVKNYIKTGIDNDTGKKVGMLADGSIEFME